MKTVLLFLTISFFWLSTFSQNIVPNPTFEDTLGCPDWLSQIYLTDYWVSPNIGSPDFYHSCAPYPCNPVNSFMGYQIPHSGEAHVGIYMWGSNARELVEVELTESLQRDKCYRFEMFVNAANKAKFTTDDIGVYFSDTIILDMPGYAPLPYNPQIINEEGNFFDTLLWKSVSGNYVAHGGENYIIIGNFLDDSTTTTIVTGSGTQARVYCYIDDVSLVQLNVMEIDLGDDTILCQGTSILLDASAFFETFSWHDGNSLQTFLFSDTSVGDYSLNVLVTDTNGCIATDTLNVTVELCLGAKAINVSSEAIIYPNPVNDLVEIRCSTKPESIIVSDISGRIIYKNDTFDMLSAGLVQSNSKISTKSFSNGVYIVQLRQSNGIVINRKLIVQH